MSEAVKKAIALTALAENFGATMSEPLTESWLRLLAGYTPEQVDRAVQKVIETHVYRGLPPFAVLKNALDGQCGISPAAIETQAIAEWGLMLDAIESQGRYTKPPFCPTTEYVLRLMGGWDAACSWETENLSWRRKEFIALWKEAHGKTEYMQLGAAAVQEALAHGQDRNIGPLPVGDVIAQLTAGKMAQ